MTFLDLLADKRTTVYSLSPESGVPKTTLTDISSGKAVRKNSALVDCYSDQLNSSINVAEVEGLIAKELADRLRARYFRGIKLHEQIANIFVV